MDKRNIIIAVLVIAMAVILVTSKSCKRDNIIYEGEYQELKDSLKTLRNKNIKMSDSLNREIVKNDFLIKNLAEENSSLSLIIDSLNSIKHDVPETPEEKAEFFNERYGVKNSIVVEEGVLISSSTSFSIINELLDKDILERSDNIKNLIIENKDSQISLLEDNYISLATMMDNTKAELSLTNAALLRAEDNIIALQKNLKKSKRNNTLIYSIGIPASIIVGVLVGNSIK